MTGPDLTGSDLSRPGGVDAVGMSTIRAQHQTAHPSAAAAEVDGASHGGWLLRDADGGVLRLDDLERVRAWLGVHPDAKVELSSDGKHWRAPEAILGLASEPGPATGGEGTPLGGTPITTGPSSALRLGVSAPRDPDRAGPVWSVVALVATVVAAGALAVGAQALHLVDLSGTVPLGSIGLGRLVPAPAPSPTVAAAEAPTPAAIYQKAMRDARTDRQAGHLVAAVLDYRRALGASVRPEALQGLADTYTLLGDTARAEAARTRLATLTGHPQKAKKGP